MRRCDKTDDARKHRLCTKRCGFNFKQPIKVDGAAIADQIKVTVESAFKPIKEAAEANGTVPQVLEVSGQASIIGRDTCANVFGVDVRDAHGNPVEVDLWNSPDAPPVDDSFIWSADILKALALGAKGGYIGRAFLYGLGALGQEGVEACLRIIHKELDLTMAFCGRTQIGQVDKSILLPGSYPGSP